MGRFTWELPGKHPPPARSRCWEPQAGYAAGIATATMPGISSKETLTMRHAGRHSARGFPLLETMIALLVLGVGILGLAAMLGDALAYRRGSQDDFIAQQKAEEAAEAIFTAKYTNGILWNQLQNNGVATPTGLFLNGPQPILQPGPTDGLVGTV